MPRYEGIAERETSVASSGITPTLRRWKDTSRSKHGAREIQDSPLETFRTKVSRLGEVRIPLNNNNECGAQQFFQETTFWRWTYTDCSKDEKMA